MKKTTIIVVIILFISIFFNFANAEVYYFDVYNHWAEKDIYYATNNINVFNGYGDWTFKPDTNITIAEYFKIMFKIGEKNEIFSIDTSGKLNYTDININHWAYTYILSIQNYLNKNTENELSIYDIFPGYKLNPNIPITRSNAAVLTSILTSPAITNNEPIFNDIEKTDPNYNIIKNLFNNSIFLGYSNKEFRPNANFTRAEAAVVSRRINDEAAYNKGSYLNKIGYFNLKYIDEFPLFYEYDNNNLSDDDFKYIKAVTTLEYLEFGGYIFPEDEPLYDMEPLNTLIELKTKQYFNEIGVNYYLIKYSKATKDIKKLYSNDLLGLLIADDSLTDINKFILLYEIKNYKTEFDFSGYLLDFKSKVSDLYLKSDIDFLLFDYYNINLMYSKLYELVMKYENLPLTSKDFIGVLAAKDSILTNNVSKNNNEEFEIIEKYILNITYSINKVGFNRDASDFIVSYYNKLMQNNDLRIIFNENQRNIIGTYKALN